MDYNDQFSFDTDLEEEQHIPTIEEEIEKKRKILEEVVTAERIYVNNLRSIKQVRSVSVVTYLIELLRSLTAATARSKN